MGSIQVSFPFFELSRKQEAIGTFTLENAGSGLGTVLAQIQAITVALGAQRQVSFAPTMLADDGKHEKGWLDLGPDDPGVLDAIADFDSS